MDNFQLASRVLLYSSSHIQDSTYHSLCYTRYEKQLIGFEPGGIDLTTHHIICRHSTTEIYDVLPYFSFVLKYLYFISSSRNNKTVLYYCLCHVSTFDPRISGFINLNKSSLIIDDFYEKLKYHSICHITTHIFRTGTRLNHGSEM